MNTAIYEMALDIPERPRAPSDLQAFVISRPYRIRLGQALQHILEHRDRIWLTRSRDIDARGAAWPAGIVPGSR